MARPIPSTSAALAVLAGAFEPAETVLSPRTRRRLAAVIDTARTEILDAVAEHGAGVTAAREDVDVATLRRWRAPGGWLCTTREE